MLDRYDDGTTESINNPNDYFYTINYAVSNKYIFSYMKNKSRMCIYQKIDERTNTYTSISFEKFLENNDMPSDFMKAVIFNIDLFNDPFLVIRV